MLVELHDLNCGWRRLGERNCGVERILVVKHGFGISTEATTQDENENKAQLYD